MGEEQTWGLFLSKSRSVRKLSTRTHTYTWSWHPPPYLDLVQLKPPECCLAFIYFRLEIWIRMPCVNVPMSTFITLLTLVVLNGQKECRWPTQRNQSVVTVAEILFDHKAYGQGQVNTLINCPTEALFAPKKILEEAFLSFPLMDSISTIFPATALPPPPMIPT